jgi:hypothetical protein
MTQVANLEDSEAWQLAKAVAVHVRELMKTVPYQEYYPIANSATQNAVTLTSDIAMAVGKDEDASFDWRFARGHLFTVKGLVLMAVELDFVSDAGALLEDIQRLQGLIEAQLATETDKPAEENK